MPLIPIVITLPELAEPGLGFGRPSYGGTTPVVVAKVECGNLGAGADAVVGT